MAYDVRAAILYDLNGNPLEVQDGVAIPAGKSGLLALGTDGVNSRIVLTDVTGKPLIDVRGWFGSVAPTVGQKPSASSIPVVLPSDQVVNVNVSQLTSTTGTTSSVAASLVTITLLLANPARKGSTIFIDGGPTNAVFVKMGAGASTVDFTNQLSNRDYYEIPFGYTGVITAVWSPAAVGFARITEFT